MSKRKAVALLQSEDNKRTPSSPLQNNTTGGEGDGLDSFLMNLGEVSEFDNYALSLNHSGQDGQEIADYTKVVLYQGDAVDGEDIDKFLAELEKIVAKEFTKGLSYCQLNQYEAAIASFGVAIESGYLRGGEVYACRAMSYVYQGQYVEAIADFDEAIENGYAKGTVYAYRGFSHFQLSHYAEAIADFGEAINKGYTKGKVSACRGFSHFQLSHYAEAIADFGEAINKGYTKGKVYAYLGVSCHKLGQRDKAMENFVKVGFDAAIEIDPQNIVLYRQYKEVWECTRGSSSQRPVSQVVLVQPQGGLAASNARVNVSGNSPIF